MQRPLTDTFPLAYAHDPAFYPIDHFAKKEDKKGDATKRYVAEYRRCIEQCSFASLTRPGAQPTLFHFRTLTDSELRKLQRVVGRLGGGQLDLVWLAVRMSLERVDNAPIELGGFELAADKEFAELGPLVPSDWMDALGDWSRACGQSKGDATNDLGIFSLERSNSPLPK